MSAATHVLQCSAAPCRNRQLVSDMPLSVALATDQCLRCGSQNLPALYPASVYGVTALDEAFLLPLPSYLGRSSAA